MATTEDPTLARHPGGLLPRSARFSVEVVEGRERGARIEIDPSAPGRTLVGQSEACALRLTDPLVSRRHFALMAEGAELHLVDQRSTNGTTVNGIRVMDAWLRGGETIEAGGARLRVVRLAEEPAVGITGEDRFGPLIGSSVAMLRLRPLLQRLAASSVPVIIEGETGTGKEVVAEAIHEAGPRASGPFVVFDCTAITPTVVESALFGHERGAFTGATSERQGVFEEADGGTLLIDEIGDLELPLQAKLLRAVQRGEVRRVGGTGWLHTDVRVIAATRRDLDLEVQAGRFREDLYYRLNVARVELPRLRDRAGDVGLLARHFWDQLGGRDRPLPIDLFAAWDDYDWPGNVRELENAVARHLALGELASAHPGNAGGPDARRSDASGREPLVIARQKAIESFERRYLEEILAAHGGRVPQAAAAAGVGRRYFNKLRARYGI